MVVLAHDELKRMHVDRVRVTPSGNHLPVVVLVDVSVHGSMVESPVEWGVEEVVDNEKGGQGNARVCHGQLGGVEESLGRSALRAE